MRPYFVLLAAVLLPAAAWLFARRWRAVLFGVSAVGHVVAFERREDDDSFFYLPVVEFTDAQQVLRRFTAVAGHVQQRPAVGATVVVRYLPSDPSHVFIASFLHMWAAPLALLVLGLGALAASVMG